MQSHMSGAHTGGQDGDQIKQRMKSAESVRENVKTPRSQRWIQYLTFSNFEIILDILHSPQ